MKRKYMILILVLLLTIGFASLSTSLNLNGTIGIEMDLDDFNVYFSFASITDTGTVTGVNTKTLTITTPSLTEAGDTSIVNFNIYNNSTIYDATVSIDCESVSGGDYITATPKIGDTDVSGSSSITIAAQDKLSGTVDLEMITALSSGVSAEYTCTLVVNAIAKDTVTEKSTYNWSLSNDQDSDGILDMGDKICFDTECFYVISNDGETLKALAEYNLEVGNTTTSGNTTNLPTTETYLQSSSTYKSNYGSIYYAIKGTFAGSTQNDYTGSIAEYYVNAYQEKLEEIGITNVTTSLITKDELVDLGCTFASDGKSGTCTSSSYSFTYDTSYWTQTSFDGDNGHVYAINYEGEYAWSTAKVQAGKNGDIYGVRPVIEISLSDIETGITNSNFSSKSVITDSDSVLIGDEFCFGSECFYVISNDGKYTKAISKYNLHVGSSYDGTTLESYEEATTLQDSTMLGYTTSSTTYNGVTAYSQTDTTYSNSLINDYITKYTAKLKTLENDIYNVSIITVDELTSLGCDTTTNSCASSPYAWVYSSSYWTSSEISVTENEETVTYLYGVLSDGTLNTISYDNSTSYGVRPVITINNDLIDRLLN